MSEEMAGTQVSENDWATIDNLIANPGEKPEEKDTDTGRNGEGPVGAKLDEIAQLLIDEAPESVGLEETTTEKAPESASKDDEQSALSDVAETEQIAENESDEIEHSEKTDENDDENQLEIDYEMLIPMPDSDEPMSLSKVKDLATNADRIQRQVLEKENALMVERGELATLAEMLEPMMTAPALEHIKRLRSSRLGREHEALLAAIPDWQNPQTKLAESKRIANVMQEYGFSDIEFKSVGDHRVIKLVNDFSKLLNGLETTTKQLTKKTTVNKKQSRRQARTAKASDFDKLMTAASKSTNRGVKLDAIAKLLGD